MGTLSVMSGYFGSSRPSLWLQLLASSASITQANIWAGSAPGGFDASTRRTDRLKQSKAAPLKFKEFRL